LVTFLFFAPQLVLATDISWTGTTDTTWGTSSNWTGDVVPGSSDNAVFNSTFSNQPNLTGTINAGGLWMTGSVGQNVTISATSGSTLRLGGNTINGTSGLGILVDNANAFTLTITASLRVENNQTWRNNSSNILTIAGNVDTKGKALTIDGTGNTTISGVISNSGAITKAGTGTLMLSGANTYSGGTTLDAGTLNINNASALGTGTFTISAGSNGIIDNTTAGAITLSTNNAQVWNGNFTFTGTQSLNLGTGAVTLGASRTVTVNANNLTVGGVISGAGFGLTKAGTGILTLAGANTYSGGTTVSGGALLANNASGSATGTAAVTVTGSGTLLGGNGTITGTVSMASGTNLSPGTTTAFGSTAILKTGALTLSSGSNFTLDLNGTTAGTSYDQVGVTGTVTITGSNIVVRPGAGLNIGDKFFILLNDASDAISGTFAQGTTVTSGADTFSINYFDNGDGGTLGNDISLTVTGVPEPATWVGAALALGVLGWSQRRRLSRNRIAETGKTRRVN